MGRGLAGEVASGMRKPLVASGGGFEASSVKLVGDGGSAGSRRTQTRVTWGWGVLQKVRHGGAKVCAAAERRRTVSRSLEWPTG